MRALLGVQSHFSFHWGVASPADWFRLAEELGYAFLGIADNAALHGLPEIVRQAATSRVRPVYGAAFPFLDGRTAFAFAGSGRGYGNLCQRITDWQARHAARPDGRSGGVPALTPDAARALFAGRDLLDGLAFVVDDASTWEALSRAEAEVYWRIGPTLAAPPRSVDPASLLFAPGPVFPDDDGYDTHRLLRAVGGGTTVDRFPRAEDFASRREDPPVLSASPAARLQSPAHYADAFSLYADAIERADALAARLALFRPARTTIAPPLPGADGALDGEEALARLRRLAYEGAVIRYGGVDEAVRERLEHEFDLIRRKNFAEYFLVVHDIVGRMAGGDGRVRRGRSVTCGRGSGAASLVNYCLGVTNVDALKHNLMFERFLNESRQDLPDIDVDFAWDERDAILERVCREYGPDRVGRVANHNRYDWRGAFRAAARALGRSDTEITRHLRESPSVYAADIHPVHTPPPEEAAALPTRAARRLQTLRRPGQSAWNEAARQCRRLVGLPHGLSMHCGGMILTPEKLARTVPTIVSRKGQATIQWEKDGAEDMGLIKIDLLGNRSLAVIRDAVRGAAAELGIEEEQVIPGDPSDDPATRALLERGDTFGVFYLESPSMRLLMAKARKGDFEHAVIHSSIIRPAANAFIHEYLERLRGKEWAAVHPRLEGLFDESYGIPVYQEDVVKLASALSGWDYARADEVRKCLGKRDVKERLTKLYGEIARDARRLHNVDDETLAWFFSTLMSMTGYSFCKPHSASYAQVSFEAAFLRAHHPAHFMAAVLSNGGGYYSTQAYVSEAKRLGLAVLGPDVNASAIAWRAEGRRAIRVGLMAVSGLSGEAMEAIVAGRAKDGPYADLGDLLERTGIAADDLRRLALVGGLDSLAPDWNRPQLLWCASQAARSGEAARPAVAVSGSLFDRPPPRTAGEGTHMPEPGHRPPPALPPYSRRQRLATEYSVLGFIPDAHPMSLFEEEIRRTAETLRRRSRPLLIEAADLARHVNRMVVMLAWPISAKIVETKKGDAMMFQSFEDHRTLFESVIFPEEFQRYHPLLATAQPLWVTGRVEEEFGVATLRVLAVHSVCAGRRPVALPEAVA